MAVKTGLVLRKLLKERRMTFKEISRVTGVPATTIAEWANDRTPKNPEQIRQVAKFLGISVHYLLFGEEDSQDPIAKVFKEDIFSGTFEISIKRIRSNE
jgi:transcriptional regulator with XRE-family HTH domain